jgi:hypothetical protein
VCVAIAHVKARTSNYYHGNSRSAGRHARLGSDPDTSAYGRVLTAATAFDLHNRTETTGQRSQADRKVVDRPRPQSLRFSPSASWLLNPASRGFGTGVQPSAALLSPVSRHCWRFVGRPGNEVGTFPGVNRGNTGSESLEENASIYLKKH